MSFHSFRAEFKNIGNIFCPEPFPEVTEHLKLPLRKRIYFGAIPGVKGLNGFENEALTQPGADIKPPRMDFSNGSNDLVSRLSFREVSFRPSTRARMAK